jgi:hypothetical protein
MRTTILALAAVLALATVASAGDLYRNRVDRGYHDRHSTGRSLSNRGIVGGRAVTSDHYRPYGYRPYGYSSYGYDRPRERIIIIEREVVPRGRWRR